MATAGSAVRGCSSPMTVRRIVGAFMVGITVIGVVGCSPSDDDRPTAREGYCISAQLDFGRFIRMASDDEREATRSGLGAEHPRDLREQRRRVDAGVAASPPCRTARQSSRPAAAAASGRRSARRPRPGRVAHAGPSALAAVSMNMGASTAIRIRGLTKTYRRHGRAVPAVRELDLEVPTGCVFGLLGPNGAGKTTVIRAVAGLVRPQQGACEVLGARVPGELHRVVDRVGVVVETPGFLPGLTARQTLDHLVRVRHMPRARVGAVLDTVGLADRADDRVGTYSLGHAAAARRGVGAPQGPGAPRARRTGQRSRSLGHERAAHAAAPDRRRGSHRRGVQPPARRDRAALRRGGGDGPRGLRGPRPAAGAARCRRARPGAGARRHGVGLCRAPHDRPARARSRPTATCWSTSRPTTGGGCHGPSPTAACTSPSSGPVHRSLEDRYLELVADGRSDAAARGVGPMIRFTGAELRRLVPAPQRPAPARGVRRRSWPSCWRSRPVAVSGRRSCTTCEAG